MDKFLNKCRKVRHYDQNLMQYFKSLSTKVSCISIRAITGRFAIFNDAISSVQAFQIGSLICKIMSVIQNTKIPWFCIIFCD